MINAPIYKKFTFLLAYILLVTYFIIECKKCGTIQYVQDNQKTRICPKCQFHINCQKIEPLAKASCETAAQNLVKSIKVPEEVEVEIKKFQTQMAANKAVKHDKFAQFSTLVTQTFGLFPNALPIPFLVKNGEELGLDDKFILKMLDELEQNGFLSKKTDARGNDYIKFLTFPIDYGQVHIKRPNWKPPQPANLDGVSEVESEEESEEESEDDSGDDIDDSV